MILVATILIALCSPITIIAVILHYKSEIKTIKADYIVALRDQATLSFRQGYMRAYSDKTNKTAELQAAKNVYQSAML